MSAEKEVTSLITSSSFAVPSKINGQSLQIHCLCEALYLLSSGNIEAVRCSSCIPTTHDPWDIQKRKEANAEQHVVL